MDGVAFQSDVPEYPIFTLSVQQRPLGVLGKQPGVTRRNAITRGVELNSLIGARFQVQGVEFEGMAECKPCYWMDEAIAPGAEALLQGRGGLRARILTSGTLRVGL